MNFLTAVSGFVKLHERLLVIVFVVVLLWGVSGKVESIIAAHDNANLNAEKAALATQVEKNASTAALVAQQAVQFQEQKAQADKANAALEQANAALVAALTRQQKADATMTLPDLAVRWGQLVPNPGLAVSNGKLTVSESGAHATVNELEKVPALTQQLDTAKIEKKNVDALLLASTGQVATLNTLVDGKNAEIKKAGDVCEGRIKVVKDEARKSKRRWFVIGYVAGFLSRQYIKTATGF